VEGRSIVRDEDGERIVAQPEGSLGYLSIGPGRGSEVQVQLLGRGVPEHPPVGAGEVGAPYGARLERQKIYMDRGAESDSRREEAGALAVDANGIVVDEFRARTAAEGDEGRVGRVKSPVSFFGPRWPLGRRLIGSRVTPPGPRAEVKRIRPTTSIYALMIISGTRRLSLSIKACIERSLRALQVLGDRVADDDVRLADDDRESLRHRFYRDRGFEIPRLGGEARVGISCEGRDSQPGGGL
jgi:hypothetical protein